ncbi:hypothetical protein F183_A16350 [Bryobacterales bacterium F-183]|nr:hypothetical protein F183_A16350 [Bryobacterales bacterium F-183]
MMSDAFVVRLLVNAAWQVPLWALLAYVLDVLLRRWSGHWRVAVWRGSLVGAAMMPVAVALWNPTPQVTAGFVLPVQTVVVAATSREWTFSVAWAYSAVLAFLFARLLWRLRRLRDLNPETASVPLTFGVRAPVVVIPERFAREATALAREAALAHETVHVEQRDYLYLLLMELVTLPVAMHPVVAWMKWRYRNAVEMRCDELAAVRFADPTTYAQGLLDAARVLSGGAGPALAAGFWDQDTLEERMTNLMEAKTMPGVGKRLLAGVAMLAVGFGMVAVSARYATAAQADGKVYKVGKDGVSAPKVLQKVEPKYSESAKDAKVEGSVTLKLEITPEGRAEKFQVAKSLEPTLDQAAIEAVKQWKFQPAQKAGKPVRVSATIEVQFRLL